MMIGGRATVAGFRQFALICALCASAGLLILGGMCAVSTPARAGAAEPICVLPDGVLADYCVDGGALSADGRYVAFGFGDVFVRDRQSGTTEQVSVASDGTQANGSSFYPALSANGRFVAFVSDATNLVPGDTSGQSDVFVRDRLKGTTERVSVGPGGAQSNVY